MKKNGAPLFLKGLLVVLTITLLSACARYPVNRNSDNAAQTEKKNIQLAVQYLQANQPLKAIARLKKILHDYPESAEAFGLLGVIYQRQQEYSLSENSFKKALTLAPENSSIRNNYGAMLYVSGQYHAAAKQFHQVSKDVYYENRDRVFENLGSTYLKMGKKEKAIEYYQHALRLNPMLSVVNLKLADLYFNKQRIEQAYEYYNRFVAATGEQSAESLWLGIRIAHEMKETEKVSTYSKQLQKDYPRSEAFREYKRWNH